MSDSGKTNLVPEIFNFKKARFRQKSEPKSESESDNRISNVHVKLFQLECFSKRVQVLRKPYTHYYPIFILELRGLGLNAENIINIILLFEVTGYC